MKLSRQVKPISYLKANAARVISELEKSGETLVITQNGQATAVLQDIRAYEQTQETLALLKLLALGERQHEAGKTLSADEAFRRIGGKHGLS